MIVTSASCIRIRCEERYGAIAHNAVVYVNREAEALHDAMRETVGKQDVLLAQLQAQLAEQPAGCQPATAQFPAATGSEAGSPVGSNAQQRDQSAQQQSVQRLSPLEQLAGGCEALSGAGSAAHSNGSAAPEQAAVDGHQQCQSSAQAGSVDCFGGSPAGTTSDSAEHKNGKQQQDQHQQELGMQNQQPAAAIVSQPANGATPSAETRLNGQQAAPSAPLPGQPPWQLANAAQVVQQQASQQEAAQANPQQKPSPAAQQQEPLQGDSKPDADMADSLAAASAQAAKQAAAPVASAPMATAGQGVAADAAAAVIRDLSMRQAALVAQVQDLQDERHQLQVKVLACSGI